MRGKLIAALLALAVLFSCRSLEARKWGECRDADGVGAPAESSAVFDWSDWPDMVTTIDGRPCGAAGAVKCKWARLKPGPHVVEYSNDVHDFGQVAGQIQVAMEAGRRYVFQFDTCYWCKPRRYAVWIADGATGRAVWGQAPDWPSWWL